MKNARVFLIDFYDSFTHNISEILFSMGEDIEVIPWDNLEGSLALILAGDQKKVVIYGPGPGKPDDYSKIFPFIKKIELEENIFQLGICLGHQILWQLKGHNIVKCLIPVHGQSEEISIPSWEGVFSARDWGKLTFVQRYNSLVVEAKNSISEDHDSEHFSFQNGEVIMGRFCRGLTYQFHPESIGTSCPKIFFNPVGHFLYNSLND